MSKGLNNDTYTYIRRYYALKINRNYKKLLLKINPEEIKNLRTKKNINKMRLTHPLTLVSSTANVFIAPCILSKLVLFQTKSTLKPWLTSTGTP